MIRLLPPVLPLTESVDPEDEIVLIERARSGDADAFRRLVGCYHLRLNGWSRALTENADDADDVAQMALVRMYRGLSDYHGKGQFTTWLYSIIRSAAADLYRSRKRRTAILEGMSHPAGPEPRPNTSDVMDRSRLTELVLRYYQELPARQREIFYLADLQGYSPSEIAEMIEVEAGTVRTHLHRARRAIRSRLLQNYPALVKGFKHDL